MVTFAAFTIASAAASAATYPFVSIMPIALSAIVRFSPSLTHGVGWSSSRPGAAGSCPAGPLLGPAAAGRLACLRRPPGLLVDRADDQRVERRRLAGEPRRRDRALCDQHPFTHPAAEHVERDETLAGALRLHLKEGAVRDLRQPTGGPDVAGHLRGKHQRSLSISTPTARARSRASGVSTARRPSTSLAPARAAWRTIASVTAPLSTRCAGCTDPGPAAAASRNRSRPARNASRCLGFSNNRSSRLTNASRSASFRKLTVSTASTCSRTVCASPGCPSPARPATPSSPAGSPPWVPADRSPGAPAGRPPGVPADR